jgi:predicted HAD superfamily Cof-like phosphohydrolase
MEASNEWMNRALALEAQTDLLKKEIEILSKSNFDMVKEFHKTFAKDKDPRKPTVPTPDDIVLRMKLMCEELQETLKELGYAVTFDVTPIPDFEGVNLAQVSKELTDLLYVTYGTLARLGVDGDEVFAEVHRSNMSKVGPNGVALYREDGKVLKGPNYTPPDIYFGD